MKLGALSVKAKESGASEAAVEGALDTSDPKAALIDLLLLRPPAAPVAKEPDAGDAADKPHFGDGKVKPQDTPGTQSGLISELSQKHIMLSYQWDVQSAVKAIHGQLAAAGLPVWMDISGGTCSEEH